MTVNGVSPRTKYRKSNFFSESNSEQANTSLSHPKEPTLKTLKFCTTLLSITFAATVAVCPGCR